MRFLSVLLAAGGALLGQATTAAACSPNCFPATALPPTGATVPANLPAVVWPDGGQAPRLQTPEGETVDLPEGDDGLRLLPVPLPPGEYRLLGGYGAVDHTCAPFDRPFTVAEPAPLPATLGRLVAKAPAQGVTALAVGAACEEDVEVVAAEVAVALEPEASPWRDALRWETWVKGPGDAQAQPWWARASAVQFLDPGGSWVGRGRDRV